MSDLSGDLVEEILCRVPAISLKRLRSTCKLWNNLFSDSRFKRKHFEKAAKQYLVLMLKNFRVCSMSVNLQENPSMEVICELCLIDPRSLDQDELKITEVFHCDDLLLCTNDDVGIIVVRNPFTGETKWIKPRDGGDKTYESFYALGSYQNLQNNKSGNKKSYKILSYNNNHEFEIYAIGSNSWRTLDVTFNSNVSYRTLDCFDSYGASLNGKTYWIIPSDKMEKKFGIFLVSFDYTKEKFEEIKGQIPRGMNDNQTRGLSVVSEEKLAVLLKPEHTSTVEIWLTNKIGETKEVSWSKVLALDLNPDVNFSLNVSFLLDEEKKVLMCCDNPKWKNVVYVVGEDNRVRQVHLGVAKYWPLLFNYVPSLTQI